MSSSDEILKTMKFKDRDINVVYKATGTVQFQVVHEDSQRYFDNVEAARNHIDRLIQTENKLVSKALDITRMMVDPKGVMMIVRGINRNDGSVRVRDYSPANAWGRHTDTKAYTGEAYSARQWVIDLLKKREAIAAQLAEVEKELKPVRVSLGSQSVYGGKVSIERYEDLMQRMILSLDTADKNADAIEKLTEKESVA